MRNCQIQLFNTIHVKYQIKSEFVGKMWPANSALFIYVSNYYCIETVNQLDYNQYSQLTLLCSGNASAFGARYPGFYSWLRQGFLCLNICFVVVVFLDFANKHIICYKIVHFLYNVNLLSILTYCKICDRLYWYKDTDIASANLTGPVLKKRPNHGVKYVLAQTSIDLMLVENIN